MDEDGFVSCEVCGFGLRSENERNLHCERCHGSASCSLIVCYKCGETFKDEAHFLSHEAFHKFEEFITNETMPSKNSNLKPRMYRKRRRYDKWTKLEKKLFIDPVDMDFSFSDFPENELPSVCFPATFWSDTNMAFRSGSQVKDGTDSKLHVKPSNANRYGRKGKESAVGGKANNQRSLAADHTDLSVVSHENDKDSDHGGPPKKGKKGRPRKKPKICEEAEKESALPAEDFARKYTEAFNDVKKLLDEICFDIVRTEVEGFYPDIAASPTSANDSVASEPPPLERHRGRRKSHSRRLQSSPEFVSDKKPVSSLEKFVNGSSKNEVSNLKPPVLVSAGSEAVEFQLVEVPLVPKDHFKKENSGTCVEDEGAMPSNNPTSSEKFSQTSGLRKSHELQEESPALFAPDKKPVSCLEKFVNGSSKNEVDNLTPLGSEAVEFQSEEVPLVPEDHFKKENSGTCVEDEGAMLINNSTSSEKCSQASGRRKSHEGQEEPPALFAPDKKPVSYLEKFMNGSNKNEDDNLTPPVSVPLGSEAVEFQSEEVLLVPEDHFKKENSGTYVEDEGAMLSNNPTSSEKCSQASGRRKSHEGQEEPPALFAPDKKPVSYLEKFVNGSNKNEDDNLTPPVSVPLRPESAEFQPELLVPGGHPGKENNGSLSNSPFSVAENRRSASQQYLMPSPTDTASSSDSGIGRNSNDGNNEYSLSCGVPLANSGSPVQPAHPICRICGEQFKNNYQFLEHTVNYHKGRIVSVLLTAYKETVRLENVTVLPKSKCPLCSLRFTSDETFYFHFVSAHRVRLLTDRQNADKLELKVGCMVDNYEQVDILLTSRLNLTTVL